MDKKKKNRISMCITISVLGILVAFVYFYFFQMADPIEVPSSSSVTSLSILNSNTLKTFTEAEDIEDVLSYLELAEPTRKWTNTDKPNTTYYYALSLSQDDGATISYRYYVYNDDGLYYVQDENKNIYSVNSSMVDLLI